VVAELAYEHMSEPEVVKIEAEITGDRIEEIAYMPSNEEKIPLLMGVLKRAENQRCVVFINTKHMAEKIEAWLNANGFKSGMLSGDVPQKKRETLLGKFKEGQINVLIATDVATLITLLILTFQQTRKIMFTALAEQLVLALAVRRSALFAKPMR